MFQDRPFNMAQLFLERIDKLLFEKDTAFINGEMIKVYRCLKTILADVNFKFEKEEIEEIKALLEDAKKNLFPSQTGDKRLNMQLHALTITKAEEILSDVDFKLISLMYQRELILPKGFKSMEEEIKDDY